MNEKGKVDKGRELETKMEGASRRDKNERQRNDVKKRDGERFKQEK
jgi:hypothetical protein